MIELIDLAEKQRQEKGLKKLEEAIYNLIGLYRKYNNIPDIPCLVGLRKKLEKYEGDIRACLGDLNGQDQF